MTFRQLRNGRFSPNLVMIRESRSQRRFWTESYENFPFNGPLKPQTWRGSNRHPHSEQATGQEMHCREIFLFIPRCSPRAREFPRWSICFVRRTVAELRGVKIAQFSDFGLFSPYKTPKKYLPVTSLQPRGYIAEWFRFFRVIAEGPKGCLPAAEFWYDFWYGAGDPKLAQIFANGKWLYPYIMLLQGASDLDQRCLKTRSSKDGCTFPQNIFAPAQNHPKPPFWGPFNAKPITERGLCKSHVNGATKLKFYIIVLGVCLIFFR